MRRFFQKRPILLHCEFLSYIFASSLLITTIALGCATKVVFVALGEVVGRRETTLVGNLVYVELGSCQ